MKTRDIYLYIFAALFTLGFFVSGYFMRDIKDANTFMIGFSETMKNGMILILGYLFGSSVSSAKKDDTIDNLSNKNNNN